MTEIFKIIRIKDNSKESVDDVVVEEIPFTIMIGQKELVTLLCTPLDLEDLVKGFLFTAGIIKRAEEIKSIVIDEQRWVAYVALANPDILEGLVFKRLFTSGCGRGTLFYNAADIINRNKIVSDFRIEADSLKSLILNFQKKSELFFKTGGVHSAALADTGNILIFKEDIGRHNAVDKVIGCGLATFTFENKILISSGRISSEILFKAQKTRVPLLISQSAPTNQAVKLAKDMGMTLVGFARGSRMNVYSHEERISVRG